MRRDLDPYDRALQRNLVRRAQHCQGLLSDRQMEDAQVAPAMLRLAGRVVLDVLGDAGLCAHESCFEAAHMVEARWLDARHALRYCHAQIVRAVKLAATMERAGLPLRMQHSLPPDGWDHDAEDA